MTAKTIIARSALAALVAASLSGCGSQGSGPLAPTPPPLALRFEAFVDRAPSADRAAVALRPAAYGVSVRGYNLGAGGYTPPVARVRVVVAYDASRAEYSGSPSAPGWVADDRSVPGRVDVTFASATDRTGDVEIGGLRFSPAPGAIPGDFPLAVESDYTDRASLAHARDGRYSQVVFGGGMYHLTESR